MAKAQRVGETFTRTRRAGCLKMSETSIHPDWLTPAELAERWRRSTDTIVRWCKAGDLPAMKLPSGAYLICRAIVYEREAQAEADEARRTMANARRNRKYQPSGIDHFGHED